MAPSWYAQKLEELESPAPARQFSLAAGVADGESAGDDSTSSVPLDILADGCEDAAVLREKLKRRAERVARLRWRYRGVKLSRGAELRRRVDLESKLDSAKLHLRKARCELENTKKELAAARQNADAYEKLKDSLSVLPKCIICCTCPRTVVFFPCGHLASCFGCANRMCLENGDVICPICHTRTKFYRGLYMP